MKYSYVAKSIIRRADGKLLILRRSSGDPHAPGRADLPGGGVDEGEQYAVAAAREIAEEAGITVLPEQLRLVYTTSRVSSTGDSMILRFLFIAQVDDVAVVLSHEHDAYEWCDLDASLASLNGTVWGEAISLLTAQRIL